MAVLMSIEKPPITVTTLRNMKQSGDKIAVLTAYDASFTTVIEEAGIDVILVGDSLGMVIQGLSTTVPVKVEDIIYHTRCVSRASHHALVMADMPFMSFDNPNRALDNAARLMQEGGAQIVKLEGGGHCVEIVDQLARNGIPVCAHLGLQPQSIHKLGGYRVQGRDKATAKGMLKDAKSMQEAGADCLLLECVPAALAQELTETLDIPTIGIGAGVACDGQVLVLYDMLGITPGKRPSFTRDFLGPLQGEGGMVAAVQQYVQAVKAGTFPAPEHTFT